MDLGGFEHGIDGNVNGHELMAATELVEKGAKVGESHLNRLSVPVLPAQVSVARHMQRSAA
jgi:hypothetical protein